MSMNRVQHDLILQLRQNLRFEQPASSADAAVLVAITDEPIPKILLTRRAADLRQHGGEVSLPGGKRDADDADNVATALREAWEETALSPDSVALVGELACVTAKSGIQVKPIVGLIAPDMPLQAQPAEIERIFYLPLQLFIEAEPQPHQIMLGEQRLFFPSICFDNEVVWGLTARVLVSLLESGLGIHKDWPFLLNIPLEIAP